MSIFDSVRAEGISPDIRVKAADALGQMGDPRLKEDNMILIPAGSFIMGVQKTESNGLHFDEEAWTDESPVHEVRLSTYKIAKYPVTVGEYKEFLEHDGYATASHWNAGGVGQFKCPENWESQEPYLTRPVVGVSWFEAKAYAIWKGMDLPTEAQWERAARGPGQVYKKYPWGEQEPIGKITNYEHSKLGHSSPVGIFPGDCSEEGICDLGGNIRQWCQDWKDGDPDDISTFYGRSTASVDPVNDQKGE